MLWESDCDFIVSFDLSDMSARATAARADFLAFFFCFRFNKFLCVLALELAFEEELIADWAISSPKV